MENIGMFIRRKRKEAGLTQEDFAVRSGLGLRFVRELEEGNEFSYASVKSAHTV